MKPDIKEVKEVFFMAMLAGWAKQSIQKRSIADLSGSKVIPFTHGDFLVKDCYFVTPHSTMSTGFTMIWHLDHLIWAMYYGGTYAKPAVPFLKQCLRETYERRCFIGGRGPLFRRGPDYNYVNTPSPNDFENFAGTEHIFDNNDQMFGSHWYRGMTMNGTA